MSDICGPFTLEGLDQFGTLDQLPFSLDDAIWESPDTCIMFGTGQADGTATVTASPSRIRIDSGSIDSFASVSASGGLILSASGNITSTGLVTADGVRMRTAIASIFSNAVVTALGGMEFAGFANITSEATLYCYPNAIWSGNGVINGNGAMSAIGYIYGEEWTNVPAGTNTWLRQN